MAAVFWVLLPIVLALGSALLAVGTVHWRLERQLAHEREALTEARTFIESQKERYEEKDRLRREAAERRTVDSSLAGLCTEQRRFFRDEKTGVASHKHLVVQERLYFRTIPLSNWLEHEVPVEDGVNVEEVAKTLSVFSSYLHRPKPVQPATNSVRQFPSASRARRLSGHLSALG